jgi:hypothetical protein
MWVLVKRCDPDRGTNKLMLITATAMFVVATLFEAVSITEDVQVFIEIRFIGKMVTCLFQAFIQHKHGSPVLYYAVVSSFLNLFHSTLSVVQVLIGDALLVSFLLAFN